MLNKTRKDRIMSREEKAKQQQLKALQWLKENKVDHSNKKYKIIDLPNGRSDIVTIQKD
jgi:uncharacterized protein YgbK (DUF1537 family)